MKNAPRGLAAGLALLLAHLAAHADLWVHVDRQGVTHFAATRVDERYELFYRDDDTASASGASGASAGAWNPLQGMKLGPDSALSRRVASLNASKGYQAVQEHLQAAAATHNIDYALLKAVVAVESDFDPTVVSPKGAVGLMQLMPDTAEHYGVVADKDGLTDWLGRPVAAQTVQQKLTDPRTNIDTGARHLAYLMQLYGGQRELALAAYNAGPGAVQRAGGKVPELPEETQDYVKTVMGLYSMLKPARPAPSTTAMRIKNSDSMRFEQGGE